MKPIVNRISKLERVLTPQVDERDRRAAEGVREARRRYLAAKGLPWTESRLEIPEFDDRGRRLANGERILLARYAHQKANAEPQPQQVIHEGTRLR